jgi:hypothetical protein
MIARILQFPPPDREALLEALAAILVAVQAVREGDTTAHIRSVLAQIAVTAAEALHDDHAPEGAAS